MTHSIVAPAVLGLDLGDRTTHLCALSAEREVVARSSFSTRPDEVRRIFAAQPPRRVVLEAGSQSPWMSALLRDLGHQVHVVDPRRIALISKDHRKTDRRDAEMLARLELGMPELLGEVHHRSREQQADMARIRARDLLVQVRTQTILHVRGTCKAFGVRLAKCGARGFHRTIRKQIPAELESALEPVLKHLEHLEQQIRQLDRDLTKLAEERYVASLALREVNGVGPITSLAFVLTVGDPSRFPRSRDVGAWLGLVPRVCQSGARDPELPISKAGDIYMRRLLVQAAHYILGPFGQDSDLRRFGQRLVERGGKAAKRRAVVAVARKLAILLHRLWVSGEPYEPLRNSSRSEAAAA